MQVKIRSLLAVLGLCAAVGALLPGCQKDSSITPSEEQRFKNPPKEIPPEALKIMREHPGGPPPAAGANK